MINEKGGNIFAGSEEESFNLKEVLIQYLRNWYWFAMSVIVALFTGYLFNRYSSREYVVTSKILVEDRKKTPQGAEALKELNIFKNTGIVENEIEIIKSRPLINKVLDKVNFDVSYFLVGDIRTSEIFGEECPFVIKQDSLAFVSDKKIFQVYFENNGTIKLSFDDKVQQIKFNDKINTPYGSFLFIPNVSFDQKKLLASDLEDRNYYFVFNEREKQVESYLDRLKVATVNKHATVLEISLSSSVPLKDKLFLDELGNIYIQSGIDQKNETAANTIEFIKERLKFVYADLSDIETQNEQYKKNKGIANVSEDAKHMLSRVKDYDFDLAKINMELEYIYQIKQNLEQGNYSAPIFIGQSSRSLEELAGKLYNLETLRIGYEKTTNKENPLNNIIKEQIEITRQNILQSIEDIIKSLTIQQATIQKKIAEIETSIQKVPTIEKDLISIQRQQSIKETLYLYLLQKQEESAIALAAAVPDNKIIEPASYSKIPVKPVKLRTYLIALFIGLSLPILAIYLHSIFSNTVISKAVVEKIAKAPIVGVIGIANNKEIVAVKENAKSIISEEFRLLRTNLQFMGIGSKEKCLIITSSVSGEGKTFISINLALTFALSGKKTVVLEMDLRKPKLTKNIEMENSLGISNYLINHATIDEIIRPSKLNDNLFVISSGPIPPNPAELLMSDKLKELIEQLKNRFDYVLIDSPPIGLVTDALLIGQLVDVSIYVVRQSYSKTAHLSIIEDIYTNNKMKKPTVVFNGINRKIGSYGYGNYGYGYGYGYTYGQGYYHEEEKKTGFRKFLSAFWNKLSSKR